MGLQVALLGVMIFISVRAVAEDRQERVRARLGPTGIDFTMSRKSAAVVWPLNGAVVVVGSWLARDAGDGLLYVGALLLLLLIALQRTNLKT